MSNLKNNVRLIGFLGSNPEIKEVSNNKKVARLSIATNDHYKNDKGERVEDTQWYNLILWNNNAMLAEKLLHKGSEIAIEGKLATRNYVDKEGIKRFVTEIVVNEFILMDKK